MSRAVVNLIFDDGADPKVRAVEYGHPGTDGHGYWIEIDTKGISVNLCFGDPRKMVAFADTIADRVFEVAG